MRVARQFSDRRLRRCCGRLLATCLAAGSAVAVPSFAIAAPASDWQVQSVPPVEPSVPYSALRNVSCPTTVFCLAVGYYVGTDQVTQPLVEKWDGLSWTILPAVAPADSTSASQELSLVSCVGPAFCEAIGAGPFTVPAFAERWDGTTWHLQSVTSDPQAEVQGLTCTTARFCMAFGIDGSGRELTWRWNGAKWTQAAPPALRTTFLSAVSCPTARSCFAAGRHAKDPGAGGPATIEHWNDGTWSQVPVTLPKGAGLSGMSCPKPGYCTATGAIGDIDHSPPRMLVVNLAASAGWSYGVVKSPTGVVDTGTIAGSIPVTSASLGSVSCSTVRVCTAIVYYDESLDGLYSAYYSVATRGAAGGFHMAKLSLPLVPDGLSCVAADCTVAGFSPVPPNSQDCTCVGAGNSAAIFRGHGADLRDAHPSSPPPYGPGSQELHSVSCVASGFCAAVGTDDPAIYARAAGEWQGSLGGGTSRMNGVSCTSPTFCMAIGEAGAEQWNGTSWTSRSLPDVSTDVVSSISCSSSTSCVAVGSTYFPGAYHLSRPLTELWDGVRWLVLDTPRPADERGHAELDGVSCPTVSRCVAVGWYTNVPGSGRPLIESLSGSAWTIVPAAQSASTLDDRLSAVSCSTVTSCIAVDFRTVRIAKAGTEVWDGTQWTYVDVPSPQSAPVGSSSLVVGGLSCISPSACTMVGEDGDTDNDLIEDWDGTKWSAEPSLTPARSGVGFDAVSCTAPTACTAVGRNLVVDARP